MGILDNIGKGKKPGRPAAGGPKGAKPGSAQKQKSRNPGASRAGAGAGSPRSGALPKGQSAAAIAKARRDAKAGSAKSGGGVVSRLPGKRKGKGSPTSPRERIASAAAPLHDRRRRLVGARETTLRDLGGLMLEMYKRNRFREELLLDKCEEVLAIEVEIAHVDQRLFQLAPPNAAGMRPIGRCECGAPIHPGQNFCGVCGRSFATLTQSRSCVRCGAGLRPGDQFCATCGTEAPDALQTIESPPPTGGTPIAPALDPSSIASAAVAETMVIAPPPLEGDVTPSPAPETARSAADEADAVLPPVVELPSIELESPGAVTPPPAEPAASTQVMPAAEPSNVDDAPEPTRPAPAELAQPTPRGFDWSAPPAAPEVAMDAAVESIEPSPTDPSTPFAGFPLSATVPPPPIVDPIDLPSPDLPTSAAASAAAETAEPTREPAGAGTPGSGRDDAAPAARVEIDPKAEKAAQKAVAASQKQRAKEAKARAKARAKAARERRKRGADQ